MRALTEAILFSGKFLSVATVTTTSSSSTSDSSSAISRKHSFTELTRIFPATYGAYPIMVTVS